MTDSNESNREHTDQRLMSLYQSGEMSAFESLYARHSGKIYSYLQTRLESREETDEVIQLVFAKFHQSRLKYDPKYPVLQWLFVISKSVLTDFRRKESRRVPIEDTLSPEQASETHLSQNNPSSSLIEREERLILSGLKPDQRKIVEWRAIDELTYEEIAKRLGRSEESVRQAFSRSLKWLRANYVGSRK